MYGSFIKEANTNGKHRDTANVFLIGALGTTDYTIFNDEDTAQVNYTVGPGDVLYICLLYTSPSPRDSCASRMPSSA